MVGGLGKEMCMAKEGSHMVQMCCIHMSSEMYKMFVFSNEDCCDAVYTGVRLSFLINCF